MHRCGLVAFLLGVAAVGCGRSNLTDELGVAPDGDDGGLVTPVDSSFPFDSAFSFDSASQDSTNVPPSDGQSPPPCDAVFVSPPDVGPPPVDVYDPPDAPAFVPDGGCGPSTCTGCCQPDGTCLTSANPPNPVPPPA